MKHYILDRIRARMPFVDHRALDNDTPSPRTYITVSELNELCSAPEPGGWQPIETAPKTGRTLLLGYYNSAGKWRTMRGQWCSQAQIEDEWEEPENGREGWYESSVENDEPPNLWPTDPTHWMPTPTPPTKSGQHE